MLAERPDEGGVGNEAELGEQRKRIIEIFLQFSSLLPFFCTYVLISFCLSLVFLFVCLFLFSPETPFHFTLPKEGDIIPPLTGATPLLLKFKIGAQETQYSYW